MKCNVDDVAPTEVHEGRHQYTRKRLGAAAGGVQLGCSHMTLPPGALSYPLHYHAANEEAIYVLAGRGTLRLGDERHPIETGDWIALPTGPAHAHQIINDSDAPLAYLCVSTMQPVDVWVYPDANKIGFTNGDVRMWVKRDAGVDYWADEPAALE
ncbi:MAG TPA: cupin domain-containing protein [Kofleriaceae bacterium]|nr:cupin domain-containing protein [Kofleriaceae bacterium]